MQELLDDNWGKEEAPLEYLPANIGARLAAFLVDNIIFFVIISMLVGLVRNEAWFITILVVVGMITLYNTAAQQKVGIGKRLMKLQVVHIEGKPIFWGRILIRTLLKYLFIGNPILFAIVTFIAQSQRKDPQQIFFQDVVTKTKVVKATASSKKENNLGITQEY